MKISPHPLSWANGYFSTEGKEWEAELTDKQRVILEAPSVPGSPAGAAARQRMAEASASAKLSKGGMPCTSERLWFPRPLRKRGPLRMAQLENNGPAGAWATRGVTPRALI